MNRTDTARRAQVIRCLIEGNSINSTVRMTSVAKNTVLKLLVEIGAACSEYLDGAMRNLSCERLQADEAWSFCYAKQKNVKPTHFDDGGFAVPDLAPSDQTPFAGIVVQAVAVNQKRVRIALQAEDMRARLRIR